MAASIKDIEVVIKRKLEKEVTNQKLNQANLAASKVAVELWRKQLADGIDGNGKRISKLSANYQKWKKRYISGKLTHRPKSEGKDWLDQLETTTEYKANKVPNYGRLTGKFFSSMTVSKPKNKNKDGVITLGFRLSANSKSRAKILQYLEQQGRNYGFAIGNSNRGKKHQNIIKQTMLKILFPKATLFSASVRAK